MSGPYILLMALIRRIQTHTRGEDNMMMKTEFEMMPFEDGKKGHKPRNTGGHWKLKKVRHYLLSGWSQSC